MKLFKDKSWSALYHDLLEKNKEKSLGSDQLYTLAIAAYFIGKDSEAIDLLTCLHLQYLNDGNIQRAVYCSFWIGMLLMFSGKRSESSGWFSRAGRLLEDYEVNCVEKGLMIVPIALQAMYSGDPEKSFDLFSKAAEKAMQFNDPDLKTISLLGCGQSLILQRKVKEGVAMLDEAMVAVGSDDVSPIVVGIVYCAVIETCQKIYDLRRAKEWTAVLSKWCDAQPDSIPFRGQCLIRKSQIRQLHGEWPEALEEMQQACNILANQSGEPAVGEAYYQMAELYRLRGEYAAAEKYYFEANQFGRIPQPGLSQLRLAQGQTENAVISIKNALAEAKSFYGCVNVLPAYIHILLEAGYTDEIPSALKELDTMATQINTPYIHALSYRCHGAFLLKVVDAHSALQHLRKAYQLWQELVMPYEIAHVRMLIGIAYDFIGDQDAALLELTAAQSVFKELEALPDLQKVNKLLQSKKKDFYGLTKRELQVLRLVAGGDTNKSIASKLHLSERTVERHMSNIFTKMNVSSRTAASTLAVKHHFA